MKITIGINWQDFDPKYKPIVLMAILRMEDVLSSKIFFEMLVDEIYETNLEGELSEWKTATPKDIHEQLFPITLYLNTYFTYNNVIGYGRPSDNHIFINTKYLSKYDIDDPLDLMEIGSNLLHEHSHDCGFSHDFRTTPRRPSSISYVLNRAYERAFRIIYKFPLPEINYYVPWYKRLWRKLWN